MGRLRTDGDNDAPTHQAGQKVADCADEGIDGHPDGVLQDELIGESPFALAVTT